MAWAFLKRLNSKDFPRSLTCLAVAEVPWLDLAAPNQTKYLFHRAALIHFEWDGKKQHNRAYEVVNCPEHMWFSIDTRLRKRNQQWLISCDMQKTLTLSRFWQSVEAKQFSLGTRKSVSGSEERIPKDAVLSGVPVSFDGPPVIATFFDEWGNRMLALDTQNYWRCGIEDLGHAVNLNRLPIPDDKSDDSSWYWHVLRDAEIVESAVLGMLEVMGCDLDTRVGHTVATCSMATYRSHHLKTKVLLHDELPVKLLERRAYHSGDVSTNILGSPGGLVYELDVQSCYPYVMQQNVFPKRLDRWHITEEYTETVPDIVPSNAIADVIVNTTHTYPVRCYLEGVEACVRPTTDYIQWWLQHDRYRRLDPMSMGYREVMHERHGQQYVALRVSGQFATTLAGAELAAAFVRGDITHWGSWAEYSTANLFASWVSELWDLRQRYKQESRPAREQFIKSLLSNLHGKFAQRSGGLQYLPGIIPPEDWGVVEILDATTGEVETLFCAAGHCWRRVHKTESRKSFTAISAFTSAYARTYMDGLIQIADPRQVHYCCVDGLYTTRVAVANLAKAGLIQPGKIGHLKTPKPLSRFYVYDVGSYLAGDDLKATGLKREHVTNDRGMVTQKKWQRFSGMIEEGLADGLLCDTIRYTLDKPFYRGQVDPDGRVKPLVITSTD